MFASGKTAAVASAATYIEDVFSTYLWTGDGASGQTINNGIDLSGKGGLMWMKPRTSTSGYSAYWNRNQLYDTVRGIDQLLSSNTTDAQGTVGNLVTSVTSTGFTIGAAGPLDFASVNYTSWTFRKQAKFFDVVTYTGTGSNTTISHSLGSVPACIMVKRTDTTGDWQVYHRSLANTEYLVLNTTAAKATGTTRWNSTTPTSTVFSIGTDATVNASGGTYVAYLFAHDAGGFGLTGTDNVISCGSFTGGNGSNAETNLGYEPQWVLVKRATGGTSTWTIYDNMRGVPTPNGTVYARVLYPDLSNAEEDSGGNSLWFTSTGFRQNFINDTWIYIAIRRGPMKVPTSGTSVFSPNLQTGGGTVTTNFPVDLTLLRPPSGSYDTRVFDRLRGTSANSYALLSTNSTAAESTGTGAGLGYDNNTGYLDNWASSSVSPIYWNFQRAPSFFDEVCYTGTGSNTTQTHNLGVAPELMIVKNRSSAGYGWLTYSATLGATKYLQVNSTAAEGTVSTYWNNTAPTSSVFSVGTAGATNASGDTFVAYLFATCAGVSKVGSYTGTGTTKQIDCGFTGGARFVLIKRTDSTGDWYVWDTARGIVSGNDPYLLLNSTAAEVTNTDYIDTYSAGFEISSTAPAAINASGGTFIFLAIA